MNRTFVEEYRMQQQLLPHVVNNLNEPVINTAVDALKDLLTDAPEIAEELLRPIVQCSIFWINVMAKEALGLPINQEFDTGELIERFELREKMIKDTSKVDWLREGF